MGRMLCDFSELLRELESLDALKGIPEKVLSDLLPLLHTGFIQHTVCVGSTTTSTGDHVIRFGVVRNPLELVAAASSALEAKDIMAHV